jgi:hypothetical protein
MGNSSSAVSEVSQSITQTLTDTCSADNSVNQTLNGNINLDHCNGAVIRELQGATQGLSCTIAQAATAATQALQNTSSALKQGLPTGFLDSSDSKSISNSAVTDYMAAACTDNLIANQLQDHGVYCSNSEKITIDFLQRVDQQTACHLSAITTAVEQAAQKTKSSLSGASLAGIIIGVIVVIVIIVVVVVVLLKVKPAAGQSRVAAATEATKAKVTAGAQAAKAKLAAGAQAAKAGAQSAKAKLAAVFAPKAAAAASTAPVAGAGAPPVSMPAPSMPAPAPSVPAPSMAVPAPAPVSGGVRGGLRLRRGRDASGRFATARVPRTSGRW